MSQFKGIITKMAPTTSSAKDFISMRIIKEAGDTIYPQLLHMVNTILKEGEYPSLLKVTKIIPISKPNKDCTTQAGWRPINLVPTLSKIVEKCILKQVLKYLKDNGFIHHTHHGLVQSKRTQTIVQEIYEMLLTSYEKGEDTAFIQLDQSKVYDVVSHKLLIAKMNLLGFNRKTIKIFTSYLHERKQYVCIDSFDSNTLLVCPQSVTQGLTLSCVLYLIFILNITQTFHQTTHKPLQHIECSTGKVNNPNVNKRTQKPTLTTTSSTQNPKTTKPYSKQ